MEKFKTLFNNAWKNIVFMFTISASLIIGFTIGYYYVKVNQSYVAKKEIKTPKNSVEGMFNSSVGFKGEYEYKEQQGRFTPNLLVCDDMLNDGVITKQSKRTYKPTSHQGSLFGNSPQAHGEGIGDSGSSSRYYDLDKWFDKVIEQL